jgi:hypothetical protein
MHGSLVPVESGDLVCHFRVGICGDLGSARRGRTKGKGRLFKRGHHPRALFSFYPGLTIVIILLCELPLNLAIIILFVSMQSQSKVLFRENFSCC